MSGPTERNTPQEEMTLITVAVTAFGALVGSVGFLYSRGIEWLIEHQLLVSASAGPLVTIPGSEGAGLDLPRLAVLAGVVVAVVAVAISSARRAIRARGEE